MSSPTTQPAHASGSRTTSTPMASSAAEGSASASASASSSATPAFEDWRKTMARFTGMGMTDADKAERERVAELKVLERDWDKCEEWKKDLMVSSPIVVFMLKHLKSAGCPFPSTAMQCHPCDEQRVGGFSPAHGVLLCQNRFMSKKHMEDTLAHELIHAYDHCLFKVDWMNLRHHACTEIRAANLSGDCKWKSEVARGFYAFSKQHQTCVRRRAVLSVSQHPGCKSVEDAERAVSEVWDSCIKDTRPFDEIY